MKIMLNGVVTMMQPRSVNWSDPEILGVSGEGIPIRSPYFKCSLGFPQITLPMYKRWREVQTSGTTVSSIWLPHPDTGRITEFNDVVIGSISVRQDSRGRRAMSAGVDIEIIRVEVS